MSSSRSSEFSINANSNAIRQEIQRFESVHPSIYAIYDLIEGIQDKVLLEQIRDNVVSIEDSFVNSQEWILSRSVPEIKLGVIGSIHSGKSALVHRYLTGSYLPDESPEGGRFKKEVILDNQSFLLMIRDEGGPPDYQFSRWLDGVIIVFSLENEESFHTAYEYYLALSEYRNVTDLPLILVGTQDAISESNPRVIDDSTARRLANDLRRCQYYETCATYGLNVERVFQDACSKIYNTYPQMFSFSLSRPNTPQYPSGQYPTAGSNGSRSGGANVSTSVAQQYNASMCATSGSPAYPPVSSGTALASNQFSSNTSGILVASNQLYNQTPPPLPPQRDLSQQHASVSSKESMSRENNKPFAPQPDKLPQQRQIASRRSTDHGLGDRDTDELPQHHYIEYNCLRSTAPPTQAQPGVRLTARHSVERDSFQHNPVVKKGDDEKDIKKTNGIGHGRAIPLKQGYLYKRSMKALNRDWRKKKYVTLTENAVLTYHSNMHKGFWKRSNSNSTPEDYMDMNKGKEIDLKRTTVKIPGVAYRQSGQRAPITSNGLLKSQLQDAAAAGKPDPVVISNDSMTQAYLNDLGIAANPVDTTTTSFSNIQPGKSKESAAMKKRHRRMKSTTKTNLNDGYDSDGYEFIIVSMNNQQWHFEASSEVERDEWVEAIEQVIHSSLQLNQSGKSKPKTSNSDPDLVRAIKTVAGNSFCADCGQSEPSWASLNLGALVCIECSGVHRQLGTHISRVRSLDLDDWPHEYVMVMRSIGNTLANSVWEAAANVSAGKNRKKPEPHSSREDKEAWIRAKYERREFLPPVPFPDAPIQQQLIDAMARQDTRQVILCLALAEDSVNSPYSKQDPRAAIHIAATLGNIVYIQLLLWYNGDPTIVDHEGRNAFFYAQASRKFECAEFLRLNGCPEQHLPMLTPYIHQQQLMAAQHQQQPADYPGVLTSSAVTLPRRRNLIVPGQPVGAVPPGSQGVQNPGSHEIGL